MAPVSRIYGDPRDPSFETTRLGNSHQYESWWTFRIGFYFFLLGEGEGGIRGIGEGGGSIFIENPRRGEGVSSGGEGAEGPGGCLRRIGEFGGGWGS